MPSKKKLAVPDIPANAPMVAVVPTQEQREAMEKTVDRLAEVASLCGHINKHFHNHEGKLTDLPCDLPKGHTGDHHAKFIRNVADPITDNKGIVLQQRYNKVEAEGFWGDAAGTPVKDIKPGEVIQLTQFQKDIVAEIMKRNPNLPVEEAVAQAKASPVWLAANA